MVAGIVMGFDRFLLDRLGPGLPNNHPITSRWWYLTERFDRDLDLASGKADFVDLHRLLLVDFIKPILCDPGTSTH